MNGEPEPVLVAKERTLVARQQLFATLDDMKARLSPSTIAKDTLDSASDGIKAATRKGVAVARSRPIATAAVVGAIGLMIGRKWIGRKRSAARRK